MRSKFVSKSMRSMLGLLGFTAVSCDGEGLRGGRLDDNAVVMYGVPTVEFRVSGKVTDVNSDPVEGISVTRYGLDLARSSEDGSFELTAGKTGFGRTKTDTVVLNFHDANPEREGGAFESKSQTVTAGKAEEGSGLWENGIYVAKDVKVEMTR